jgi:hypothetical protein
MSWQKVVITDSAMAKQAATGLLAQLGTAYRQGGLPPGVAVYRDRNTADYVYYFSPKACTLAEGLLRTFHASRCPHSPNVQDLTLIPV